VAAALSNEAVQGVGFRSDRCTIALVHHAEGSGRDEFARFVTKIRNW
jgi:hypothetical protein